MSTTIEQDLSLPGIGPAVRVTGCRVFPKVLESAMPGWPLSTAIAEGPAPPIRIETDAGTYRQVSPALPEGLVLESPVEAACSVIADLIEHFLQRQPEWVGLHCASVEVNGRLVLFPEYHRSGKSTLTAALAGAGQRIFGDDVLVLDGDGQGMALGIAPRLRLPLSASVDVALHAYTAAHAGAEDERYRSLDLPAGQLARHGESLPLGAVALLERDEALARSELVPLAPGEGLTRLLRQHFAQALSSEALMERFLPLVQTLPCRLLRYAEPVEAARCLGDALPGVIDSVNEPPAEMAVEPVPDTAHIPVSRNARWRTTTAVHEYALQEERFLIHQPSGAIHRLNATGQMVWGLLQSEPMSAGEVIELLADHFSDVPAERIDHDVRVLLGALNDAGLILPM